MAAVGSVVEMPDATAQKTLGGTQADQMSLKTRYAVLNTWPTSGRADQTFAKLQHATALVRACTSGIGIPRMQPLHFDRMKMRKLLPRASGARAAIRGASVMGLCRGEWIEWQLGRR